MPRPALEFLCGCTKGGKLWRKSFCWLRVARGSPTYLSIDPGYLPYWNLRFSLDSHSGRFTFLLWSTGGKQPSACASCCLFVIFFASLAPPMFVKLNSHNTIWGYSKILRASARDCINCLSCEPCACVMQLLSIALDAIESLPLTSVSINTKPQQVLECSWANAKVFFASLHWWTFQIVKP